MDYHILHYSLYASQCLYRLDQKLLLLLRGKKEKYLFSLCFHVGDYMSSELKTMLTEVAVEDYEHRKKGLEEEINRYKSLLLKISREKKLDLTIMVQGTETTEFKKDEQALNLLEKAHLVEGITKYTHRNVYRQYELTPKGTELVEKLTKEN